MKLTTREWITGIAIGTACGYFIGYVPIKHLQKDHKVQAELDSFKKADRTPRINPDIIRLQDTVFNGIKKQNLKK